MKPLYFAILLLTPFISAGSAVALTLMSTPLPYADAPRERGTQIALSYALAHGVIEPRAQIFPRRPVTRAEFVKMIVVAAGIDYSSRNFAGCFVDTPAGEWFSPFVCAAKKQGVVKGYWQGKAPVFLPHQPITYAEAAKILIVAFKKQTTPSLIPNSPWYEPFIRAINGFDQPDPFGLVSRALAVTLISEAMAQKRGEIYEYMQAIVGSASSASSSRSTSSMSSFLSSSAASSVSSQMTDPLSDTQVRSGFALLGETSPVLASVQVFLDAEPLIVRSISIDVTSAVSSMQSLLVYDENKRYLGRATLDASVAAGTRYTLAIPSGSLSIPRRTTRSFYVRGSMLSHDLGGVSGQYISVEQFLFRGFGEWSASEYNSTSPVNSSFAFQTARAVLTHIANAQGPTGFLSAGPQKEIGSFTFEARRTDGRAHPALSSLSFQLEPRGGVDVSNVYIRANDTITRQSCSVSSLIVTCAPLGEALADLSDGPRTLTLFGDISLLPGGLNQALRVTLNFPGSSALEGDIQWTDGFTSFTRVPFSSPIAQGTLYR